METYGMNRFAQSFEGTTQAKHFGSRLIVANRQWFPIRNRCHSMKTNDDTHF